MKILYLDSHKSQKILQENYFLVKTGFFVYEGDSLTNLKYEYKDYTYYIDCSTIDCSLSEFNKIDNEYDFWISIVQDSHDIEINNNPQKYSIEYIEYNYSNIKKDKFSFTW